MFGIFRPNWRNTFLSKPLKRMSSTSHEWSFLRQNSTQMAARPFSGEESLCSQVYKHFFGLTGTQLLQPMKRGTQWLSTTRNELFAFRPVVPIMPRCILGIIFLAFLTQHHLQPSVDSFLVTCGFASLHSLEHIFHPHFRYCWNLASQASRSALSPRRTLLKYNYA